MDIAQLGMAVDTSDLDKAKTSLNALVPAARAAEQAADNVAASIDGVSKASTATTKTMNAATGATNASAAANKVSAAAAGQAANDNKKLAASHAGLSTQAMAAQHSIRSMVEGLASGMPVSTVLTQQLNHLSYAASGPGGLSKAFGDAIGMFSKFIGAGTLVVGGIASIIVGFGALAASTVKGIVALGDLSERSNFTIAQLHALQQAMSFKGVAPEEFETAINAIAKGVSDASHNMGGLNDLFRVNGIRIRDNVSDLASVADLVARTADGQQRINILQAAGLPTTQSFVRFMAQGGAAIKAAAAGTVQFNSDAERNLIAKAREFDEMWNKVTTNFANYMKSAVISAINELSKLGDIQVPSWMKTAASTGASLIPGVGGLIAAKGIYDSLKAANPVDDRFGSFSKPSNAASLAAGLNTSAQKLNGAANGQPKTPEQARKDNSDAQARIAILGDLATVQQQVTQKQLELNAAGMQGVGVNDAIAKKILLGVQAQAEQNRVNQMAQVGVFNLSDAQKAASDTLQHWIDQGLVNANNVQQMAAAQLVLARNIKATSDAAAIAAAPLQQLKQLELDSSNFAKVLDTGVTGALNSLVQPIQDVMNGVTSLGQGFKNMGVIVLQAIQQMIIKMLILAPIAKALQAVLGGFGGLFGFTNGGVPGAVGPTSLGGAPLIANALGGVYNSPSLSAFSGQIISQPTLFKFATGAGLMGEAGPEGILPLKRGPSGALGVQMYGQQASNDNNSSNTQISYAPVYNIGGNVSQEDLAQVKKAQAEDRANFTGRVAQANKQLNKRNYR